MFLEIIKFIALFLGVLFTINNIIRVYLKNNIPPMNIILQTLGIVAFIFLQFHL
jgi:hypothetical protein